MKILTFSGSPRELGRAFGESCREAIAALYARRLDNAIARTLELTGRRVGERDLLALAQACLGPTRAYHADGADELEGIAEGAGLSPAQILAMNGLTDLRDALAWPPGPDPEGCTAFVAGAGRTEPGCGLLCGQTWDLATDNLPFMVVVHRVPDGGRPETWSLTTVGCLSLIGMNAAGLCVGNTNLSTTDNRVGVMYLSVLHKALSSRSLAAAQAAIVEAPRVGAHFFYVADAAGEARAIECTARRHAVERVGADGVFVHTNHVLVEAQRGLEARAPTPSSQARLARMGALLEAARPIGLDTVQQALADREGGARGCAICVEDCEGINTNGAVILAPQRGRLWVCHGPPGGRHCWTALVAG